MALARTHRPVWQPERCLPCGACTRRCPSSVFDEQVREAESLRGRVARAVAFPPGPERPPVPPCRAACPLGQDVPGYLQAVARGDLDAAARVIYRSNPLPSVCGRLCQRACMRACARARLDEPVAIRALKGAAVELANGRHTRLPRAELGGRVVVIGAGPAGLSAAFFLRRLGWQVVVLEAEAEPGGLLRWAVGSFDLPRGLLRAEIAAIEQTGVEIQLGQRVCAASRIQALLDQGARAVVLATGAGRGLGLGLEKERLPGCTDAVSFARRYSEPGARRIGRPVVVAGAGPMAVSIARVAVRAGADRVTLVMRRARSESPADPDKLSAAEAEGVSVLPEHWPTEVLGEKRVRGVRLSPVAFGVADDSGRRWPRVAGSADGAQRVEVEAGVLVAAADREPDLAWLAADRRVELGPLGNLAVDRTSYMTAWPGVFAAGDAVCGARNVVEAIATGMRAAAAVDRYCRKTAAGDSG